MVRGMLSVVCCLQRGMLSVVCSVACCLLSAAWHVVCCLQPELPRFPSAAPSAAPSFLSREPIRHTHHEGCTQCRPFSSSWGLTLPPRLSHLSHHAADCALELDLRSRLADEIRAPSPRLTSRFVLRASCGGTALVLATALSLGRVPAHIRCVQTLYSAVAAPTR